MISATPIDHSFIGIAPSDSPQFSPEPTSSIRSKVILTEAHGQSIAFPSAWVEEIILFPRQRLLQIPFYHPPVLGLIPHNGNLVLLLDSQSNHAAETRSLGLQENIRAIRLGSQVESLAGTAILIDKILGTVNASEITAQSSAQLFSSDYISSDIFLPYRWG